jgi:hypothetical protein
LLRRRLPQTSTLLLASLALAAAAFAQQQPVGTAAGAPVSAPPYRVGERLGYSVSFSNFLSAAHAETYVAGRGLYFEREGVELRARVETVGVVSAALLKLGFYHFSFVDPVTGLPYRTHAQAADATPPALIQDAALARPPDVTTIQTPPSAAASAAAPDLLSALFRLRALPLAAGARFDFTAEHAGVRYDAELRVEGRETVNTPAGSFNTLAARVRVRNNDRADDLRLRVNFSDDERRVPVRLTARLRSGEIRVSLASDEIVLPAAPAQLAAAPTPGPRPTPTTLPPVPANPDARPRPGPARPAPTPAARPAAAPDDLPFSVGEQLNFNFFLGNSPQPVGTASFQVRGRARYFNRDGYQFSATMATNQALDKVFSVRDQINSYVDASTLLPFRAEMQIQEGPHRLRGVVTLDQERGGALLHDGTRLEIPAGTYDLVSILYALRSFDLAPPKRNAVVLLLNKRPRLLYINSIARETINVGGQPVSAYQLALSTDEAQGDRLALRLWVGTDRRRLPLRLTATTPLGPVRADLAIIPLARQ